MKHKKKKIYQATGEIFPYNGKFYQAQFVNGEKNICKKCAFGHPERNGIAEKSNPESDFCATHQCELDVEAVFYQEVK